MENILKKIKDQAIKELKDAKISDEIEKLEKKYLGRNGEFTKAIKNIKDLAEEKRPIIGKLANEIRTELENGFNEFRSFVNKEAKEIKEKISFDPTLQANKKEIGHLHPITIVQNELIDIFRSMSFMVLDGPELDAEYYNFETLNIPENHPARDMQDTYFIKSDKGMYKSQKLLLRTHTSNMEVRAMQEYGAPLYAIFPGKCYRNESIDASHDNTFYQLEGLVVDKDASIANLIAIMNEFLSQLFKRQVRTRLRPGYFPFVEPGFELDLECLLCNGEGCAVCKNNGWLEFLGCGLSHPNVLRQGGLDPKEWNGFAFGMGVTRLVMLMYGIDDIRLMNSGDLRFTKQF